MGIKDIFSENELVDWVE